MKPTCLVRFHLPSLPLFLDMQKYLLLDPSAHCSAALQFICCRSSCSSLSGLRSLFGIMSLSDKCLTVIFLWVIPRVVHIKNTAPPNLRSSRKRGRKKSNPGKKEIRREMGEAERQKEMGVNDRH